MPICGPASQGEGAASPKSLGRNRSGEFKEHPKRSMGWDCAKQGQGDEVK